MKYSIYILLTLLAFVSCSDDDKHDIDKNIEVEVFYKLESLEQELPDVGAKVFIYYEKSSINFFETKYSKDGIFVKDDETTIRPDQSAAIGDTGITIISPIYYDKIFTIVIESGFYAPQLKHEVFPSINSSFIIKKIFEKEKGHNI